MSLQRTRQKMNIYRFRRQAENTPQLLSLITPRNTHEKVFRFCDFCQSSSITVEMNFLMTTKIGNNRETPSTSLKFTFKRYNQLPETSRGRDHFSPV